MKEPVVCRLTELALGDGYQVHIYLPTEPEVEQMDARLWDFRPDSFVPHARYDAGAPPADTPVTLGCSSAPPGADLLISLAAGVPSFADGFKRVAAVMPKEGAAEQIKAWRELGCELKEHLINRKSAKSKSKDG